MEVFTSVFRSNVKCTNCLEPFKRLQTRRQCSVCELLYCEKCSVKVKKSLWKDKTLCEICFDKESDPSAARLPTQEEYEIKLESFLEIQKSNPLSRYEIIHLLGESTTGEVFEGVHTGLSKTYSVNSVYPESMTEKTKVLNKIYMLKSIQHPNILKIKEVYYHLSIFWIVTKYMEFNLQKLLPLPPDEAVLAYILKEITKGLSWLHRYSKIHSSICPSNILVSKKGLINLSGFGKSSQLTVERPKIERETRLSLIDAPEEYLSEKSDVWSLGILAVELAENEGIYTTYVEDELPEVRKN